MANIVNAALLTPKFNAINSLAGIESIKGQRAQNALMNQSFEQSNALFPLQQQGAEQGLDAQKLALEQARLEQAASILLPLTDQIVASGNPKALARQLIGSPQLDQLPEAFTSELRNFDFDQLDDDTVRAEAQQMGDMVRSMMMGPQRFGAIGNTDLPNSVREYIFRQSLTPDEQAAYDNIKRGPKVTEIAGVPHLVVGQGTRPLSTPEAELNATAQSKAAETAGASGGLNLTPGQQATDQAFADEFTQWQASGGFADVEKNLNQISGVADRLDAGEELTGPMIGNQPRPVLAMTNPDALDALEQVEEVVQRNLRLVLGAQFTEREGTRLIARAYNPRLSPALNAKRLRRLEKSLRAAAKAKQEAADYFAKNGTLAGFKGRTPTIATISNEIENSETLQERVERLRAEVEEAEARVNAK